MQRADENFVYRKLSLCKRCWLIVCNVAGGLLVVGGIVAIAFFISLIEGYAKITKWSIGFVLCLSLVLLSIIWSSGLQKLTFTSRQSEKSHRDTTTSETARWKASMLSIYQL